MGGRLKLRAKPMEDAELVGRLAALDDSEWEELADIVRGEYLIPLAHLVLEGLDTTADRLADRLGDQVMLDDVGRRAVSRTTARELFAERDRARAQAEAMQRARWAAREAEVEQMRARMDAIHQAQEAAGGAAGKTAFELMMATEDYQPSDERIGLAFGISSGATLGPEAQ